MERIDLTNDSLIPLVPIRGDETRISVAEMTGKKPETVLNWVRGGTKRVLHAVKIGGSWYTTEKQLEAFMCTARVCQPKHRSGHEAAMASLRARLVRNESRKTGSRKLLHPNR